MEYVSEIASFVIGLLSGVGATLLRVRIKRRDTATHGSTIVNQSGAIAGNDIVAGSKTTNK